MPGRYEIELEPEVRSSLDSLPLEQYAKVEAMADLLAERAEMLGEPYARHLGGKVRELRFLLHRGQVRVSYWLAPGQRVVLLTVFAKTRASTSRARWSGHRRPSGPASKGTRPGTPVTGPPGRSTSGSGTDEQQQ
jgi:phage-related protein